MNFSIKRFLQSRQAIVLLGAIGSTVLGGCWILPGPNGNGGRRSGLEIKFLAGSALDHFCEEAAERLNARNPRLDDGTQYYLSCEVLGSGDVVSSVTDLGRQLRNGTIEADDPAFPTLVSVDGGIYHALSIYQIDRIFPGQNYIPGLTDAPLLAYSPMVLLARSDIADGLRQVPDPYGAIAQFDNHRDIDPSSPPLPVRFVHTAPTRSNSGLQTLVAQFAAVTGKRPEEIDISDVKQYQDQVRAIQAKITRYGTSTSSLARDMVQNGPFWASTGSVYESLVIRANTEATDGTRYEAIYPAATYTSNMRAILPNAPWVSDRERAAALAIIEFLRSPQIQEIATDLGLRPGVPGVPLSAKFDESYGVIANPQYDSYRPPQPEVVAAMLESWQLFAKKSSQVVVVVDVSGSMRGKKLAAVQNTLLSYINNLGPKEQITIVPFSSDIGEPVLVDGTPAGRDRGIQFVSRLRGSGGTRLYDATLFARDWLQSNYREDAINAVLVLTDGDDTDSQLPFGGLQQRLESSNFESDRGVAVFTIGYGGSGGFNPDLLKQLAHTNGGYYSEGDPETIVSLMADLQLEF
ncbi:Mg-chelatase subunit chlD [Rubidibacter lacunae KORDI 51-2]|uniref:Mg-chelatase subunit chlD n=1 Tax=Rubidibacter lacunae KORDI 51-2 TaxID=582515 RepID=U5DQT0_9CHRO|nr:extracellular solute-binding protein [Rubidibacter lacunae]ERN42035.1 Mg-chelatase subunit chlD [Rubidibacter lacunae KORDI 51-2]